MIRQLDRVTCRFNCTVVLEGEHLQGISQLCGVKSALSHRERTQIIKFVCPGHRLQLSAVNARLPEPKVIGRRNTEYSAPSRISTRRKSMLCPLPSKPARLSLCASLYKLTGLKPTAHANLYITMPNVQQCLQDTISSVLRSDIVLPPP